VAEQLRFLDPNVTTSSTGFKTAGGTVGKLIIKILLLRQLGYYSQSNTDNSVITYTILQLI
jgi:hypothetical protein